MLTVVDSIYNIVYYVPFVSLCTIALIIEMGNTEVFVLQLFQSIMSQLNFHYCFIAVFILELSTNGLI